MEIGSPIPVICSSFLDAEACKIKASAISFNNPQGVHWGTPFHLNGGNEEMRPPEIADSTEAERRKYIRDTFPCIADCDMCGLCTVFRGKDPEVAAAYGNDREALWNHYVTHGIYPWHKGRKNPDFYI